MITAALALQIGATNRYPQAAVVSDHHLASAIGAKVLSEGGNAVDAAVATGFALAVCFPAAGNIGGGGFMVIRRANGESFALDYREIAPKAAFREMYLDAKGNPTSDSYLGYRAAGVPGTVAGFWEAHMRFGKLPWKRLVQPALTIAAKGFELSAVQAGDFSSFGRLNKQFPATYRNFAAEGGGLKPGQLFRQVELAKTLERIRDLGRDGFYQGKTAEEIDSEMRSNKGLITKEDLASYKPEWRQPLVGKWNGAEVITMPPPSSGGIIVLMMLGMLKDDDLKKSGLNSAGTIHLMAESMKRCFADRAEYMADPGFAKVPIQRLLDPIYLASRRAEIDDRATSSTAINPGLESPKEKEHTTHFSIVDAEGNAASQTYTINDSYGSKVTSPKLGFIWNNEMDDFTAKPGSPNRYKILQGEVNSVQAGKRPLSSMTPTIVTKDGKLWMVLGSPGGPTIINTVFETILNVGVHGLTAQRAVSAPRFHHQWFPDQIRVEPGISTDTLNLLRAKGHEIDSSQSSQGSCHLILLDSNQTRTIGCDPRVSTSGHAGY